jgi:glycosyltransferase involved in cell wall biosynthesis
LKRFDAVLVEMTFCPSALTVLRQRLPNAILLVRSHNAELIHRYHWACAQGVSGVALKFLSEAILNCRLDVLSGRRSDVVLPITDWEADVYWKRLIPVDKVKYVPFFLPEPYASELKRPAVKRNLCIHFGSSLNNPLIADATRNFLQVVKQIDTKRPEWKFHITGAQPDFEFQLPDRVRWLGLLPDPYTPLRQAKAMALLSDYGMGFKTKILEAALAKAFVLLPPGLYKRLPQEIQPYCIQVDVRSRESFLDALDQSDRTYPEGDPNALLRQRAFDTLDEVLHIPPSSALKRDDRVRAEAS